MFNIDASEFDAFASELSAAASADLVGQVRPAVERAGVNIKNAWTAAGDTRHFTLRVGYDVEVSPGGIELEVGTERGGASNLDNIAHFGGVNGGGGTVPDPQTFLDAEEPALIEYVGDVVEDLL